MRSIALLLLALTPALAQRGGQQPPAPQTTYLIKAGHLIDVRSGRVLNDQTILVQGDRIAQVGPSIAPPAGAKVIDLSHSTILPGLIDNHTHVLLQAHPTPTDYDEQLVKESIP